MIYPIDERETVRESRILRESRPAIAVSLILILMLLGLSAWDTTDAVMAVDNGTIPPNRPELTNASMECAEGYDEARNSHGEIVHVPHGWRLAHISGGPLVESARVLFEQEADSSGGCFTERTHVERIDGLDSVVVRARDLETLPDPGKAFDVILSQTLQTLPGGDYSLSGWMLSLCGGSYVPSDCPEDAYISKALGIDPTGGSDPFGDSVVWTDDIGNFVDENNERIGWSNLRMGAQAEADSMTIYARLNSPYQHHGNHGFIDSVSVVRAPKAWLWQLPKRIINRRGLELTWSSSSSPDTDAVDGTYQTLIDIQVRQQEGDVWQDIALGVPAAQNSMLFCASELDTTYEFRIRARAEQPPAPPEGVWPNHRYPGVWSDPMTVRFVSIAPDIYEPIGDEWLYLPAVGFSDVCD